MGIAMELTEKEVEEIKASVKRREEMHRFLISHGVVYVTFDGKTVAKAPLDELIRISQRPDDEYRDEMTERHERFSFALDRGLSLHEWQQWLVSGIIDKRKQDASIEAITEAFADEFDRRFGTLETQPTHTLDCMNVLRKEDTVSVRVQIGAHVAEMSMPYEEFEAMASHLEAGKKYPCQWPR